MLMKLLTLLFVFLSGCSFYSNHSKPSEIIVVASTALVMEQLVLVKRFTEEHLRNLISERQIEYTKALSTIKSFGYTPYIVEPCLQAPTYLDQFSPHVCYTQTNNLKLKNKGINEAISLKAAFEKWRFGDEDMIIKVTGRYYFIDNSFITFVENHRDVDGIVKEFTESAFTGCFAMKYKWLKDFLAHLDLEDMENNAHSIEFMLGQYIKEHPDLNILQIPRLGMQGRVFNDGVNVTFQEW